MLNCVSFRDIEYGEYVLTNTVYGLSDGIKAENYELYAVSE